MPLPAPGSPWPPPAWADIYSKFAEWSAWYSGDPDALRKVYQRADPTPHPRSYPGFVQRGGVKGAVSRFFWGTPARDSQAATKLHVPAASDLASTASNLLFAEAPKLTADDGVQDRLDELFGPDTIATLSEGTEVGAALSGVFFRIAWDREVVPDRPFVTAVHADAAIPTFRWGRLAEVTFHRVLSESRDKVLRHLEHHAPGGVTHALYLGTAESLGDFVPLGSHPETQWVVTRASEDGEIEVGNDLGPVTVITGVDVLDVVYWPHLRPNRIWRSKPVGAALGRSVLSGVEPLMDSLDESYTSWMRDIRLGKARVLIAQSLLETGGPGAGASFDLDREVFTELNAMAGKGDGAPITLVQFKIRHAEHKATCDELWQRIVDGAEYSAQTFGLTGEVAMTATESNARERKTNLTRMKQTRIGAMVIGDLAERLLLIDRAQFGTNVTPARPDIEFAPLVSETPRERAESVQMFRAADVMSVETGVRMAHPDWDDDQVQTEVAAIAGEQPDPAPAFDDLPV